MKRIAIIGCSGSGKSTLARQLGAMLHIPVVHLDALFWKPGWIKTPQQTWIDIQEGLIKSESWIIDGNYTTTLYIRLKAADTIIFLDYPCRLSLYRALKRRVMYAGKSRVDIAPGCPERIDWSHIQWIWAFPSTDRLEILQKLEKYREGRTIIILHSLAETRKFLEKMQSQNA